MKAIITGGAGFIGSNMADFLLKQGAKVKIIDNFISGKMRFIEHNLKNPNYSYVEVNLNDVESLNKEFKGDYDIVFHFAANADVKGGPENHGVDLRENVIATHNVLEAMRVNGIKKIVFSSTGSIYGEPEIFPTPEDAPFPIQTSKYGASKLGCEGFIEAYCETHDFQAWIFRFVSIMGERYTHGVVFSFFQQLMKQKDSERKKLIFLSDGTPLKSYLYIRDCINAIWTAINNADDKINIFNLGTEEEITAKEIADIVVENLGLKGKVDYQFSDKPRGWIGDSPHIILDISKIKNLGWKPELSIREAILKTLDYLKENEWVIHEQYFREKY